jgi:hypothetical protein
MLTNCHKLKLMNKTIISAIITSFVISGCASSAKNVPTSYVPTVTYQNLDCGQLNSEAARIQALLVQNGGQLDKAADNDKVITGVAILVFWPAIFFLGNKTQEAEYGRLKGTYDAINKVAVDKKCTGVLPTNVAAALNNDTSLPAESKIQLPVSGFAEIGNANALPTQINRIKTVYSDWLINPLPRAFVLAADGSGYGSWGNKPRKDKTEPQDPAERALYRCEKAGKTKCKLYAIDNNVVWVK